MLDTTRIHGNLHQGSFPPAGCDVAAAGFDVLVLTAMESQPPASDYPGVRVIHAPFDDAPLGTDDAATAEYAADKVADLLRQGKRVLVTCQAGRNRSGLVCGLALHRVHGWSGQAIVRHIQQARPHALTNTSFATAVRALTAVAPVRKW